MRTSYLLLLTTLLFTFFSCSKDRNKGPYNGCCENEPIEEQVGSGSVYIPNIFTPDGDGFNDEFFPFFSPEIEIVNSFVIKKSANKIMYSVANVAPDPYNNNWDGKFKNKTQEGLFTYVLEVTAIDGTKKELTGKICNYL